MPSLVTVTVQVSVLFPSAVLTVITAVPSATAVTLPFSTVAMLGLSLAQLTALFVASAGATVAVSVSFAPSLRVSVFLFSVTPVTATTDEPEEVQ